MRVLGKKETGLRGHTWGFLTQERARPSAEYKDDREEPGNMRRSEHPRVESL